MHYSEPATDFRDFLVRVTAVIEIDGANQTFVYDVLAVSFPDNMKPPKPADEADGEGQVEPENGGGEQNGASGDDFGEIDGNRGGAGQGESERVDPSASPTDLLPESQDAHATEPNALPKAGGNAAAPTERTEPSASEAAPSDSGDEDASNANDEAAAEASPETLERALYSQPTGSESPDAASKGESEAAADDEPRIPGFAWAVELSALTVAAGGGAVAFVRARRKSGGASLH